MKSRDWPIVKQNVPDPYKFLTALYEIWYAEHGYPDVTITFEKPENEDVEVNKCKG